MADNGDNRTLDEVRVDIDAIDREIQQLISRRAKCAQRVADIKLAEVQAAQEAGDAEAEVVYYRPEREAQVLQRIIDREQGPLAGETVAHIFREVMSACLALEKPLQVAYLGPEGTFTQAAAIKHFGHAAVCVPQGTIASVFAQVESGECNYGVVPVENSTEGMVSHTLDNFMDSSLKISGEVEMGIAHHLLVAGHTGKGEIKRICAHQQALAQCRNWLDRNWPDIEREAVSSNGEAARMALEIPGVAAIAGDMAAELYGLEKLAEHIEDYADNTTRFLIIGREEVPASGRDKTSIIVSSRNKPGALFTLLDPFRKAGVSLTRIDTRPSRTEKWAYVFFIEFEGHMQDENVAGIVRELEEQSILLKPLGSYPQAVL
ncbi:chorismate mutase [Halioglobus japonicus]|uniref:Bifunctional chorismate mutase/prephenate dehydratase n=1 Tax=Halioglobus japonicus TaxID=930805 RepID=A0AAP8SPT5_9GAMM|nr:MULTISPECIES: prephenate dehydratase [Halioglobus]AQA19444.1 chorismate mutase [Halioglobus japonicus]KZX60566.1 prephenate dehydratase [Halioglobus sp. HI00S01]PLW87498.1 prephenate dehydratase [Halioglobus japonicus]GHD08143.1 chorismate mutase [Halioglobus japonicus]